MGSANVSLQVPVAGDGAEPGQKIRLSVVS
jgi:hypothetical protein